MTSAAGESPDRVPAGTIGKAHGLDGSVYVTGANAALLTKGALVFVGDERDPRKIERRAGTDERPILRVEGSVNRNDAEALRGLVIGARIEDAPALGDQEYWAHDLVGCEVQAQRGPELLGEVLELQAYPSCEVLRVGGGRRGELLIPMVRDAIVEIDLEVRRIIVDDEFLALDA